MSSKGKYVKKFEAALSKYINAKNIILLNSGTSALHIALLLMGVKSGDEVILAAQ